MNINLYYLCMFGLLIYLDLSIIDTVLFIITYVVVGATSRYLLDKYN